MKFKLKKILKYLRIFEFKYFRAILKNPKISIHESSIIGKNIEIYPNGTITIEKNVKLFGNSIIVGNDTEESNITIKEGTKINYNFYVNYSGGCFIGKNCAIATNVSIITSSLDYKNVALFSKAKNKNEKVVIEDNCWIGTGAIILPGVKIPSRTIIAAGSVVTKIIDKPGIYAGIPAKMIKEVGE